MKVRGTDFILYKVSDMDKGIQFYRDTLGLEIIENYDNVWVEFNVQPTTSALYANEKHKSGSKEKHLGGIIFFAVENMEETIKELEDQGFAIIQEPVEGAMCWSATVADPDGNEVGLHQRKDRSFG